MGTARAEGQRSGRRPSALGDLVCAFYIGFRRSGLMRHVHQLGYGAGHQFDVEFAHLGKQAVGPTGLTAFNFVDDTIVAVVPQLEAAAASQPGAIPAP